MKQGKQKEEGEKNEEAGEEGEKKEEPVEDEKEMVDPLTPGSLEKRVEEII